MDKADGVYERDGKGKNKRTEKCGRRRKLFWEFAARFWLLNNKTKHAGQKKPKKSAEKHQKTRNVKRESLILRYRYW